MPSPKSTNTRLAGLILTAFLGTIVLWLPWWWGPGTSLQDRFAPTSALFTGLALAGVALSIWIQLRQERNSREALDEQLDSQRRELKDTLYSSRIDSLIHHYRQFVESDHYIKTRQTAWNAIQRALLESDFRQLLTAFHDITKIPANKIVGYYRMNDNVLPDEPARVIFSWNEACRYVDDMIAYFSILSTHIHSVELLGLDTDRMNAFKQTTTRLNVYWEWWAPSLRFVVALRQQYGKH